MMKLITRPEALRISRSILECAEQERLDIADQEAKKGIQEAEYTTSQLGD